MKFFTLHGEMLFLKSQFYPPPVSSRHLLAEVFIVKLTHSENTLGTRVSDFQWLPSHQASPASALYAKAFVSILCVEPMR